MTGENPDFESGVAPLVSVLIPLFNHEQFIAACLDSLLQDGYPELEVVIVDDGSRDGSARRVRQWRAAHPEAFRRFRCLHQENAGVCRTLNRLVGLAQGDYCAILASDDMLLSGGITARVQALDGNPQWLAVFGDCHVVDKQGNGISDSGMRDAYFRNNHKALLNQRLLASELILRFGIPGPAFMARREAYGPPHGVGPYDETLLFEDRDFYLRLAARGTLGFIDAPVAAYRMHTGNSCGRRNAIRIAAGLWRSETKNVAAFHGIERFLLALMGLRHGFVLRRLRRRWPFWPVHWALDCGLYAAICMLRIGFDAYVFGLTRAGFPGGHGGRGRAPVNGGREGQPR